MKIDSFCKEALILSVLYGEQECSLAPSGSTCDLDNFQLFFREASRWLICGTIYDAGESR